MTRKRLFNSNMEKFLKEKFSADDKQKNCKIVKKYLEEWKTYRKSKMMHQENALNTLFRNWPKNDDLSTILLKVSVLNNFYSTKIDDTYSVGKLIFDMKIDSRLKKNDLTLVDKISKKSKELRNREIYSFASKYCSFHKPEVYPIFDSRNEIILNYYKKEMQRIKFNLRDYDNYMNVINLYKTTFGLEQFTYKEIDRFNWLFCNIVSEKG